MFGSIEKLKENVKQKFNIKILQTLAHLTKIF